MKAGYLAAVLAMTLAACNATPQEQPDVDIATLREIGDRFDRAQLTQDRAAMEQLTTEDFVLIGSDGTRQNREQFIAGFTTPGMRFELVTPTDRYFIPLGPDAGLVGGEADLRGTSDGTPFSVRIRFTDSFRRIDGEWKAVLAHATRVPAPDQ